MSELHQRITAFFQTHPANRLGVAVSGGGDSIALLRALAETWPQGRLFAASVDHGLRAEARAEAQFVGRICQGIGVPHTIIEWQERPQAGNLMDNARRARRALLADWARDLDLDAVALGHTQDDVAETFLMRLGRAAGVEGLSSMAETFHSDGMTWLRPVLHVSRDDLRHYCRALGQDWIDDPTNDDPHYDRTNIRRALLALQKAGLETSNIAASAGHLARARTALGELLLRDTQDHTDWTDGVLHIDGQIFAQLPDELQRLWLRAGIKWRTDAAYAPRGSAIASALAAIAQGQKTTLGGCVIWTQAGRLNLGREFQAVSTLSCGSHETWDKSWQMTGPDPAKTCQIKALGAVGLRLCADWRATGRSRNTLLASPAVWQGDQLIAAPLAEPDPKWQAKNLKNLSDFFTSILSR